MTAESDYALAIATFGDWLKNLAPLFQPIRTKTKPKPNPVAGCTRDFSGALTQVKCH